MKILFIGNSHTYYNAMPQIVQELFCATGQKPHVTMLALGGKNLCYHAASTNVPFNIRFGGYDVVIAQEKAGGFDPVSFREGAKAIKDMADEAGSAFYLYMPWTSKENRAAQNDMTDVYQSFCRANGCFFAPAGEVFGRMLLTEPADALYREDGSHATLFGSYVAAVTVFYTITGRKRIMKVADIEDPGVKLGFPVELCQRVHTEACRTMRLFNG
ncbi:MAG: hypothetical protein E7624_03855 [Ruminococcaceae bacterium]|nr:hypothetical protein [Oscillospiraceae bacterium]